MTDRFRSMQLVVLTSIVALSLSSAGAFAFEPKKYFQSASALSAIASVLSDMNNCEEDLKFSEANKTSKEEKSVLLTIACDKWPEDDGKIAQVKTVVEFELNDDGSLGRPLGFDYD